MILPQTISLALPAVIIFNKRGESETSSISNSSGIRIAVAYGCRIIADGPFRQPERIGYCRPVSLREYSYILFLRIFIKKGRLMQR